MLGSLTMFGSFFSTRDRLVRFNSRSARLTDILRCNLGLKFFLDLTGVLKLLCFQIYQIWLSDNIVVVMAARKEVTWWEKKKKWSYEHQKGRDWSKIRGIRKTKLRERARGRRRREKRWSWRRTNLPKPVYSIDFDFIHQDEAWDMVGWEEGDKEIRKWEKEI